MPDPSATPVIVWLRRDLRLSENPALDAAVKSGRPVLFLFIRDEAVDAMGAAAKWRLGLSLQDFAQRISQKGCSVTLRSGAALQVLRDVIAKTGAVELHYSRDYTPFAIKRDTEIKSALSKVISVNSHNGMLLFEPWTVETGSGSYYKVYTPFWNSVRDRVIAPFLGEPDQIRAVSQTVHSESLEDWALDAAMDRGSSIVSRHVGVGEQAAQKRLTEFTASRIGAYKADRDRMDVDATSHLSENLTYGEISPRQMWHAGFKAMQAGAAGAEHFLKELVWREFAYHLLYHSPHMLNRNWRDGWSNFPWRGDNEDAEAWRRGQTGEPIVDAAMREMYVTGTMHNRSRMIVASYLTKHLMVHWKVGMDWFAECLTDWDPAANAMGWQWVAGCGPDASPFFRVFNPQTQAEKFDPLGIYRKRFLDASYDEGASFYRAVPRSWGLSPDDDPPEKLIELKAGRERALAAYKNYTTDGRKDASQKQDEHA